MDPRLMQGVGRMGRPGRGMDRRMMHMPGGPMGAGGPGAGMMHSGMGGPGGNAMDPSRIGIHRGMGMGMGNPGRGRMMGFPSRRGGRGPSR